MQWIHYEHPLDERTRTYLRVEALLEQLYQGRKLLSPSTYPVFFGALFNLLDQLERSDLRADLMKDLDRREQRLRQWAEHPDIDTSRLEAMQRQLRSIQQQLNEAEKFGLKLSESRFLGGIRQRMGVMGAQCHTNLPELQYWLQQSDAEREDQSHYWLSQLDILQAALALELMMLREQGHFDSIVATRGAWQSTMQGVTLLRLKVPAEVPAYPLISGSRLRVSIRFMQAHNNERIPYDDHVSFQLARCSA